MDKKYDEAAQYYGFECSGCRDNCCMTHFYHHTLLEYFYVAKSYSLLPDETGKEMAEKSKIACDQMKKCEKKGERPRIMCPANFGGACLIYSGRPMICRLHGIPHETIRLNNIIKGPGCGNFDIQNRGKKYSVFDRAPIYMKMARLEKSIKRELKIFKKIKMTVAQMIVEYEKDLTAKSPGSG